jgi:hypothetical protein
MSSWSRCIRDVGKYWILLTSDNIARPLLTLVLRILSLASPLPTYIRNGLLVVKPGILLAYAVTDGRLVKLVGNGFNVSREE